MLFKLSLISGLAAQAMAMPLSATLTPLVSSINLANVDLITSHVRLNVFHGTSLDLRGLKRQTYNTLNTLNDIASAIGDRRLDEIDSAGVVGALNPIFINLDLLAKASKPKHDLLGASISSSDSAEIVDAVADTADNLASAIGGAATRNWAKIFRDVNRVFINNIKDARDDYGSHEARPRPLTQPLEVIPVAVAAPYPAPPTYDPTVQVGTAALGVAGAGFEAEA